MFHIRFWTILYSWTDCRLIISLIICPASLYSLIEESEGSWVNMFSNVSCAHTIDDIGKMIVYFL